MRRRGEIAALANIAEARRLAAETVLARHDREIAGIAAARIELARKRSQPAEWSDWDGTRAAAEWSDWARDEDTRLAVALARAHARRMPALDRVRDLSARHEVLRALASDAARSARRDAERRRQAALRDLACLPPR